MSDILSRLEANRILSIESRRGGLLITEACDGYFSVRLTVDEARELARALVDAASAKPSIKDELQRQRTNKIG